MQDDFNNQSLGTMSTLLQAAAYSADCSMGLFVGGMPGRWAIIASYGVHEDLVVEARTESFLRKAVSHQGLIVISEAAEEDMPIFFTGLSLLERAF